jgi:hypothetical protein
LKEVNKILGWVAGRQVKAGRNGVALGEKGEVRTIMELEH